MKKFLAIAAAGAIALSLAACSPQAQEVVKDPKPAKTVEVKPVGPQYTEAQKNAIEKAKQYLDLSGFSKAGLLAQLEFEKFTPEDSTFALEHLDPPVDWNKEAAEKGAEYLKLQPMSRQALIDQLIFEKFTPEEAAAGATANGL